MRRGKKMSETIGQILLWVFLIAALLIFSVPFIFMITNSFEEFSYVLPYPPKLLPDRLDFSAYAHILGMDIFPTAVKNSVINTCLTVAASVLISTLSAYGFARIDFPGPGGHLQALSLHADDAELSEHHPAVPRAPGHRAALAQERAHRTRSASYSYTPPPTSAGTPSSCGTSSAGCRIRSLSR